MVNYTDGNTRTCGLLANPARHTLSPFIHNNLAQMFGINMVYVPFEVPSGSIQDAVKGAKALNILGLNVTIPYKNEVIPYLDDIDPLAKGIGAVNTIVRMKNGGFKGYNTDMTGLYRFLQEEGVDFQGKTVVILGAGGVARPAAFLCGTKGAEKVFLLNRTYDKAESVADEVNKAIFEYGNDEKLTADGIPANGEDSEYPQIVIPMRLEDYKDLYKEDKFIVLQCTSVGLFPDVNSAVIEDSEFYKHVSVAMDMIYRPIETKFMKLVKEAGATAYSGLKMLLYQGIDAFELWNNEEGDEKIKVSREQADEVYRLLELEIIGARNIILEGFMGSGKSTVAEELAALLDMELLDTDKAIEEAEERTIKEIFEQDGEASFRDMETELIESVVAEHYRDMVVSLGGGLPLREKNGELLKAAGKIVYLRTKAQTVYNRLKGDTTRPLLKSDDPLKRINDLLGERSEKYESIADIIIDTDELTPAEIAREIINRLGVSFI
ncbi:shikimate kinase [Butyrivibrio sp. YAB3001]|uniref:shikimate kinase n=1 Tax=Butyrivibrio sp. YAB3001 TaxID=1520812 RepID=UPI0008F65898|nr:shikimate kinase [Butyrivibrio sp. YAB3001]SFC81034.1 shikimate dehydrogenase [Butyrivibrio sp. YAB3001]